jgi:fluoride exporter
VIWAGISLFGAVGAVLRYLVDGYVHGRTSARFPFGIFAVNVLGCFVFGVASGLLDTGRLTTQTKLLIGTGFSGSFTTFSTYTYETVALAEHDAVPESLANLVGSVVAGLAAAAAGLVVGTHL